MSFYTFLAVEAASITVPRLCEYWDSTNMLADDLITNVKNANNLEDKKRAWNIAINEIMLKPGKHAFYLSCKIVGDSIFFITFIPKTCAWLKRMFDYVRYLSNMSENYLENQYPIIKDNTVKLFESAKKLENATNTHSDDKLALSLLGLQTSPAAQAIWPYIKAVLKFLLETFWSVTGAVISNLCKTWPFVETELVKYILQVCGCTLYLFKKINELYHFCFEKIELNFEAIINLIHNN